MKRLLCWILTVCCTALMVSCADSVGDTVLIVPSSHSSAGTGAVVTEPLVTASVAETEAEPAGTAPVETSPTVPGDSDTSDALSEAEALLADESFLALLSQYQGQSDTPSAVIAAVLAYQRMQETEAAPDIADIGEDAAVYWTAGGSVWHMTDACSALAKSKSILSGSEAQAISAGKTRVCKRCSS